MIKNKCGKKYSIAARLEMGQSLTGEILEEQSCVKQDVVYHHHPTLDRG